jgi:hypothetical protein
VSQEPEAGLARLLDQGRCSAGVTLALGVIYTALLDLLERGEGLRSIVDPGSRPPVRRLVRYCSAPGLPCNFQVLAGDSNHAGRADYHSCIA